jgi:DNA polymerase V
MRDLSNVDLDEYLIENKDASFILQIRSDSYKDMNVLHNDLAIVERGVNAKDGEIILVPNEGAWTLKYKTFADLNYSAKLRGIIREY